MSADFLYFKWGDVTLPVDADDVPDGVLYQGFDPARDRLLDLFKTAINQELAHTTSGVALATSAWGKAANGTTLATSLPVQDVFWEMPTPDITRETKLQFPLLALYREETSDEDHSLALSATVTTWGLDYILPPLAVDDLRRLGGALDAARVVVNVVLHHGGHPVFDGGAYQFGPGKGKFDYIGVMSSRIGAATFGSENEGAVFRMLHMQLKTKELLDRYSDGIYPDFEGFGAGIGVGGFEGIKPNLIEIDSLGFADPNHGDPIG